MSKLERIHLAIIQAVSVQGSLTAAAKSLHLTQSALSHTMRKLEDQLGVAIWHREGRGLRLSQAGEYLLALANRMLPQLTYAEERLQQYASGQRGELRIGMECHPCYQWLLKVVAPYLAAWQGIEVDIKQKFQFNGIDALLQYEIDILVTPDPLYENGLFFEPVFDYEQVLIVNKQHPLSIHSIIEAKHLANEVLITYPVSIDRLDIYQQLLIPAGIRPRKQKIIENTDMMLQMVASGRGVAALPLWLAQEYMRRFDITPIKITEKGIQKSIYIGFREADRDITHIKSFIEAAKSSSIAHH